MTKNRKLAEAFIEKNLQLYSVQLHTVATESICTLYSFVEGDT